MSNEITFEDLDAPDNSVFLRIPKSSGTNRYLIALWIAKGYVNAVEAEMLALFLGIPLWQQPTRVIHEGLLFAMMEYFLQKDPNTFRIKEKHGAIYEFQQQAEILMRYFSYEEQDSIRKFFD